MRVGKGAWQVVFERAGDDSAEEDVPEPLCGRELTGRGVTRSAAMSLATEYATERVTAKIELFDWHAVAGKRNQPAGCGRLSRRTTRSRMDSRPCPKGPRMRQDEGK